MIILLRADLLGQLRNLPLIRLLRILPMLLRMSLTLGLLNLSL